MIVCHCQVVSDRAIRRAVREGASSTTEVARACGAGGRCGGCSAAVEAIIESETQGRLALRAVDPPSVAEAS